MHPQQTGRVGTNSQVLNLIFYKSSFKTLVGLRPNPIFSAKITLNEQIFLEKNVFRKLALIHSILHQTGTITSGFEGKKRKHSFRFFLGFLLKYTENRKECFLKISSWLWYVFYKPSSNLENRTTVCMGYPAMPPKWESRKTPLKGAGNPCG